MRKETDMGEQKATPQGDQAARQERIILAVKRFMGKQASRKGKGRRRGNGAEGSWRDTAKRAEYGSKRI